MRDENQNRPAAPMERAHTARSTTEEMVRVDGHAQVLEMLRAADPEFREILLRGIEKRDSRLARQLRAEL